MRFSTRWLILILVLTLGWLQYRLWFGAGSLSELYELRAQLAGYQQELDRLKARNRALAAEVENLKSGYAAIEERARYELGMIQRGEMFIQVIETKPRTPARDEQY